MKIDGSAYYPRLEAEMILRHITRLDLKDCIKLKYNTLCKKVNGELRFSFTIHNLTTSKIRPFVVMKFRLSGILISWSFAII